MTDVLAVIGIMGGLLCAVADLLLDLKGADNKKLGKMKIVDSKWIEMGHSRFVWSGILAMFAVPMYSCGFVALMFQLYIENKVIAIGLTIVFLCGAMGGFMIHTFLCLMPTIYRKIAEKQDAELGQDVAEAAFRQIYVPFFTFCTVGGIFSILTAFTESFNAPKEM